MVIIPLYWRWTFAIQGDVNDCRYIWGGVLGKISHDYDYFRRSDVLYFTKYQQRINENSLS